jgi:hypothetical protein
MANTRVGARGQTFAFVDGATVVLDAIGPERLRQWTNVNRAEHLPSAWSICKSAASVLFPFAALAWILMALGGELEWKYVATMIA